MDSNSNSNFNSNALFWNKLPLSARYRCLKHMDQNTRTSLKLCAWDEKHLVEYVPSKNHLEHICVCLGNDLDFGVEYSGGREEKRWEKIEKNGDTLKELEEVMQKQLSNYDSFEKMDFYIGGDFMRFQLSLHHYFLKCRKLHLSFKNYPTMMTILKQFDPKYLEKLTLDDDNYYLSTFPDEFWEMKQTHKELIISSENLGDHQLLQIKSSKLSVQRRGMITTEGVNLYIKKRLLNLDQSDCSFDIKFKPDPCYLVRICWDLKVERRKEYGNQTLIVHSPFPEFKLLIFVCNRCVRGTKIIVTPETIIEKNQAEEYFVEPPKFVSNFFSKCS